MDLPELHPLADEVRDTLAVVNITRSRFGLEPMSSLPTAQPGNAGECLYARAFGDIEGVHVGGFGDMRFDDTEKGREVASFIAALTGGRMNSPHEVQTPPKFRRVIAAFDNHEFPEYESSY